MTLLFAFGLVFQMPVVLTLLARAGIVDAEGSETKRKYAVVMTFVAAAVLTPPDPISQLGLAVPTLLLYELSIQAVRLVEKRRAIARKATRPPDRTASDGHKHAGHKSGYGTIPDQLDEALAKRARWTPGRST